jgi:hypothetical protein
MSDIRTSFAYDPIRQGYDTNSWRTTAGAPSVIGGRLFIDNGVGIAGTAVHYADFLKGDISFNVNVPAAPNAGGDVRLFGVSASSSYIRFSIGTTLTCQTSNGITTTVSPTVIWNDNWTGANIIFRIRWEPGGAKFFVNGTQVYAVSDASVPHGTLSLYLYDNAASSMSVGTIDVRGTQSFVMNPKSTDTTPTDTVGSLFRFDSVTITENIALTIV